MGTKKANPAARPRWRPWPRWSGSARWGRIAVALALGAALGWLLRGVAAWILLLIAGAVGYVDALHQGVVWNVLLFAVGVALLRHALLRLSQGGPPSPAARGSPPDREPSDLARLADLVRRAETSALARQAIGRRLSGIAVALRTQREGIPPEKAWEEFKQEEWPPNRELEGVLRPEEGWNQPRRAPGYRQRLHAAVDLLSQYADGGTIDRT